jgi:lipopolysaccharide transport system permease protein
MSVLQSQIPTVIAPPGKAPALDLERLWRQRAICFALARRNLKVRYKQTIIGAAWAIIQPLILMAVFTVFFGMLIRISTDDIPYVIFVFTGLVLWHSFSRVLNEGSASIVTDAALVTRVYFPRIYLPLSAVLTGFVDQAFSLLALVVLLALYEQAPGWPALLMPFFLLLAVVTAFGCILWLAPTYAAYRDTAQIVPFITQLGMFLSPVIYPSSMVPSDYRLLYALNPMSTAIDGWRWGLLGGPPPGAVAAAVSVAAALAIFATGLRFFLRRERLLADVV